MMSLRLMRAFGMLEAAKADSLHQSHIPTSQSIAQLIAILGEKQEY